MVKRPVIHSRCIQMNDLRGKWYIQVVVMLLNIEEDLNLLVC